MTPTADVPPHGRLVSRCNGFSGRSAEDRPGSAAGESGGVCARVVFIVFLIRLGREPASVLPDGTSAELSPLNKVRRSLHSVADFNTLVVIKLNREFIYL